MLVSESHVNGLCYKGKSVEVVDKTAQVHQCITAFSTTQGKFWNWDTWKVAGQEGLASPTFPIVETHFPSRTTYFLQCSLDVFYEEVFWEEAGGCFRVGSLGGSLGLLPGVIVTPHRIGRIRETRS